MKYCKLLKLLRCEQVNLYGPEKIGACVVDIQKLRLCIIYSVHPRNSGNLRIFNYEKGNVGLKVEALA